MDINQIAQMAGVSRATVSRYLNDGYVSQEKRKAIARVIKKTGYVPSQHAKTLRTGKTNVVGVIIPKINSASISRMVAGISRVLNEAGYQVLLANTDNDPEREIDFIQLFSEHNNVDGVILIATVFTPDHTSRIDETHVPLVVLDQSLSGHSCVYQDDYGAVRELTKRVLARGEHPAYIGVRESDVSAGYMRRKGFLDACGELGMDVPETVIKTAGFTVDDGYTCTEELLNNYPQVDTVICATDSIAYGALTCLREHDYDVPNSVQVTGVGDGELSQIVIPSLTTVHHHYKTSGSEAAKLLVGIMTTHDSVSREIKMGYELVMRNSTR